MSDIQLGERDKDGFIRMPVEHTQPEAPQSTIARVMRSYWLWMVAGLLLVGAAVGIGSHPEAVPRWAGSSLRSTKPSGPTYKVDLPPLNRSRVAVMIEKEARPSLLPVLLNFLHTVPDEWPFVVYTGEESHAMLTSARLIKPFIDNGKLTLKSLVDEDAIYDSPTRSTFLAQTPDFWESLPEQAEQILMFDINSLLCANSQQTVNDFLGFDKFPGGYAWAATPWSFRGYPAPPYGGNGGFSIRRKSFMLKLTRENEYDGAPEDLWFAARIKETNTAYFPDTDTGLRFYFEAPHDNAKINDWIYKPLGVHAGGTCDLGDIVQLLMYCPEAQIVIENKCLNDG